ncbi:CpsD/CapB family tyrosine-protein kinase [Cohnella pontilimi]|uniref:non-specific protein-tyrosine kinase n=1 Tax=Cohnella pontilimi TaxID=2564100 RepID=A0A4U0FDC7_9BACL|nr:CpsD/CapB family tyrosine-protein kinase [Cohnella pontilimi]TJY42767.1 CpsD/CapB family tyrosine-protein kinase [Cohnella pontilimi]
MARSTRKWPLITEWNPRSPISEAYKVLRTNIEYSNVDDPIGILMVTSSRVGEGKSTTSANLAVTYAQAEKKVLLIDADLRKPTQHHIFQQSNRVGLTTVLTNQCEWSKATRETTVEGLSLITSGPIPPNPSELLGSKRMETLILELKQQYDLIVLDTPPVLAVTDPLIVSRLTDGVLLMADAGKIKREMILKAKGALERVEARILGVVLNNINRKTVDGYYYGYYGTEETQ